ncbi:hypothetical protein [Demequina pelophila]|uniref:hypothetical protein n=1 Tax=Demequina pelophila TaxID=1638984 RepID=UPI000783F303|nr:hypothetical protein [Demequina pelophila]
MALSALGVVAVLLLGWFFGVKPQLDEAGEFDRQTAAIEANTEQVNAKSALLDEWEVKLADADQTAQVVSLHAPARLNVPALRDRLWAGLEESRVELVSYGQSTGSQIDGWEAESGTLAADEVAALFQLGPVASTQTASTAGDAAAEGENAAAVPSGWTPVVAATSTTGPVVSDLRAVEYELNVVGTPEETHRFLEYLADSNQPLFQVYSVLQVARAGSSGAIAGVSDAQDGDVQTTIRALMYVLDADTSILDESLGEPASVPTESVFRGVPNSPAQPGA